VTVSQENAIEDAVAKTLEIQPGFELPLGYRVEVDDYYQIAVIDLRVSTTSRRSLYSLSACEQLALFGSLRETLTTNPNWEIKEVYFTNLGEDLVL
jgi:pheromone shutdown protein TraB